MSEAGGTCVQEKYPVKQDEIKYNNGSVAQRLKS